MNAFFLSLSGGARGQGSCERIISLLHLTNEEAFDFNGSIMSKQRKSPPLSKTDLAILSVLWRKGKATGREIFDDLIANEDVSKDVAYTTVKTYVDRLIQKGYAKAKVTGPPNVYVYAATVTREEIMERHEVLEHVIDSLHLTPSAIVRWFDARQKLTPEELAELKKIIEESNHSS